MSHSHPVEEFNFPNDVSRYRTIRNLTQFREMINNENSLARRKITFEPTLITGSDGV